MTLVITPTSGFELDVLSVTGANGKEITLTKNSDGSYSFTQPKEQVSVSVTFKKAAAEEDPTDSIFTDVVAGAWYANAVVDVAKRGLMLGYADTDTFGVGMGLTRAELAQVLYRAAGADTAVDAEAGFPANTTGMADVEDGVWYTAAANWAVAAGVIEGFENADGSRSFGPGVVVTFEQAVKILTRYIDAEASEVHGTSALSRYTDGGSVSGWAASYLAWATDAGLVSGYENADGTFTLSHAEEVARERFATILSRAFTLGLM